MEKLTGVLAVAFMAFVIERLTQYLGGVLGFDGKKWFGVPASVVVALILSILVTVNCSFNFFVLFEIEGQWVWLGYVLTAIAMSGGSNMWHEIMSTREARKEQAKAQAETAASYARIAEADAANKAPELLKTTPATGPPAEG